MQPNLAADRKRPAVTSSTAILPVGDVARTITYYREVLGFEDGWTWGDPPTFGGVRWGSSQVMFSLQPDLAPHMEGHGHWFGVVGVDDLYEQHRRSGAQIIAPIENKPWGEREYTVRDLNGFHLRFGGPSSYRGEGGARPGLAVQVLETPPTPEQFAALWQAVGWGALEPETARRALAGSLLAVTAVHGGQTVGMARVVGDGVLQFYVQDVMVLPAYQGQGVGTALMYQLLRRLSQVAPPGAFVSLFTAPTLSAFYERFGFRRGYGMAFRLPPAER